jgi:N-acyl homoserine lactone hydrolase
MGDGSLMLPTPGHAGLGIPARPPPGEVAAVAGRRSQLGADLLERRQLPGVGARRQLAQATQKVLALKQRMPGLVILPAHDPTAAQRLLES